MLNEYDNLSDDELIDRLRDGDENITDYLLNKYKNLVRGKANSMFIIGGDKDDLIQEGMIGLFKAIKDFDCGRDASFYTFAELCITRQMYTAIQAAGRKKHGPLNSYMSIYEDDFQKEGGINPEDDVIDKERVLSIEQSFEKELSNLERQVLDLKLMDMDYKDIAAVLGKSPKSIDNTLQRIKTKLKAVVSAL